MLELTGSVAEVDGGLDQAVYEGRGGEGQRSAGAGELVAVEVAERADLEAKGTASLGQAAGKGGGEDNP